MADDFLTTYAPLANDIAQRTGVDPSVVLGIIDTETGGGKHVSGNNIFGISPVAGGRQVVAGYPDVQTASEAFIRLMQTPRYAGVVRAGDPASQATALVKGGYNTVNPQYASIVANKALRIGKQLGYQDQGSAQPTASTPPAPSDDSFDLPATPASPPPAQPPQAPPSSAKDELKQELSGGGQQQPSTPPASNAQPSSAKEQLKQELSQPSEPGALTGPPEKKDGTPYVTPPAVDDYGNVITPMAKAPGPIAFDDKLLPIMPRPATTGTPILDAIRQGWQGTPSFLTPEAREAVNQSGPVGRYITNPLLDIGSAALGVGGAVLRGGQETVRQMINPLSPQLARDVAALPEAFPTGPGGPRAPEAPAPVSRPQFVSERLAPPRPPGMTDLERIKQLIAHDEAERAGVSPQPPSTGGPTAAETTPQPTTGAAPQPTDAGQPGAAGAQVTTAPIPDKTKAQTAVDIRKDVAQTAADRAGTALKDDNVYFNDPNNPIPPRPQAYRDFTPQTALDHKYYYSKDTDYRAQIDAVDRERNNGMTDSIKTDMGDANTLEDLEKSRREVTPGEMGVFKDEKPVDPKLLDGYRKEVEQAVNDFSKRKGVRAILEDVHNTLFDKDGNIETLPSKLQQVRDNMTDWLDKKGGIDSASKDVRAAEAVLTRLVDDLNPVMNSGAPKWDAWRAEWADRSKLIDRQRFLQNYAEGKTKSLWDRQGNLQFRKVEQLLDDIANAHDKPIHAAQALTPDQIQKIVTVRNELAAKDFARTQAAFPGSPTHQLMERAAKEGGTTLGTLARMGAEYTAHGIGAYAASRGIPGVNAAIGIYQGTRPLREARKAGRRAATLEEQSNALKQQLLTPGPTNPLQP